MQNTSMFIWSRFKWLFFGAFLKVFLETSTDILDGVLSGNYFCEDAIAGIGLVSPIFYLIYFIGGLVSVGTSVQFCEKMGSNNKESAKKVLGEGLTVSIFLGLISAVLLILLRDPYLSIYSDVSAETLMYANSYYTGVIAIAAIYPIYWLIAISVYNDGDILFATLCELTRFVCNLTFSILFIHITNLGTGALSFGTFVAVVAGTLFVSIHFLRKNNNLGFKYQLSITSIKKSISVGFSTSLPYLPSAIMYFAFSVYISNEFGDQGLTVCTIVVSLVSYLMIWLALGVAMIPLFSVYYGEKNYQQCWVVCKVSLVVACVGGVITAVLFNILAPYVPIIYSIETPEIINTVIFAARMLGIFAISYTVVIFFVELYSISGKPMMGTLLACLYGTISPCALMLMLTNICGLNAVVYCFAFAPLVSMLVVAVVVLALYKKEGFPFYLPQINNQVFNCDILINKEKPINAIEFIDDSLYKFNLNNKTSSNVMLVLEEMLTYIQRINKRNVLCEISLVNIEEAVRLTIRDNGKLFDIKNQDIKITSLNAYVLDSIIDAHNLDYLVITNFNRNTFSIAKH